jgi:hypothetical protein
MRRSIAVLILAATAAAAGGLAASSGPSDDRSISVTAGGHDRRDVVVAFDLPRVRQGGIHRLRDRRGREIPLQIDDRGRAWFTLPQLKAGEKRTYRIVDAPSAPVTPAVTVTKDGDHVRFSSANRPILTYQGTGRLPGADVEPVFRRGGYIHPVHTPSGRVVTDDYPPDHRHHHGIWFAWTRTEFQGRTPDFWNMGQKKGTVEFESLGEAWEGAVHAGWRARHRYVDLGASAPVTVLGEAWEVRVYAPAAGVPYFLFDLEVTQTAETDSALVLPEYHYGGLGVRGARGWAGAAGASFLTSEGRDRSNGHGTRGRWCFVSGRVDGQPAGIAILGHPDNFRAPQPMRIHPTEPFFCFAPSQLGRWVITGAAPYVSRYRFATLDGPPDPALLDRLWRDYAEPPAVVLK